MWHKTFAGFLSGLTFFLFIPTAISLFVHAGTAWMMTLTILLMIPAWAGIMTYCYAASTSKQAWLRAMKFSIPSGLLYLSAYLTVGFPLELISQ